MLRLQREPNSPYWYIRGRVAGHPIHESTRTTDRRKAEAYRRKREAEIYDAAALGRKPAGTWGQAVNCYLDHGKSPRFLLPLVDLWGDKSLDKIDQAEIDRVAKTLYPHVCNATLVRQCYGPINAVLRHAAECGIEGVSPRRIKFPKVPKRKVTRWADDDYLAQLLPHCDPELAAVVLLMTYTGLRTGEALSLTVRSFKVQPGRVLVDHTKNGEAASVKLPPRVQEAVMAVMPAAGRAFAWSTSQGLCRALQAACQRAGLDYLAPHKIGRHAFAARLLRRGYDIKTVKEAGRWKKLAVVDESYGHLEQRAADAAIVDVAENLPSSDNRVLDKRG
jgi:integrase